MRKTSKKRKSSLKKRLKNFLLQPISYVGLSVGLYFVVLSLTPSLVPRTWLFQGIASGLSLINGYAIGALAVATWKFLHLREPTEKIKKYLVYGTLVVNVILLAFIMTKVGGWQNRVRELVGVEASLSTNPIRIIVVAIVVATIILFTARIIRVVFRNITRVATKYVPARVAIVIGAILTFWLFGTIISGTFRANALRIANNTFSLADRQTKESSIQPTSDLHSSGPSSLVSWEDLGKQGRQFIGTGPSKEDIARFNPEAKEPIRVYTGLTNGESHEQRAKILLKELVRTGAFERSKLVIATTTGTGYLDPNAVDTFEYIHGGDTAIAGQQYSYLPSWLALLTDTETAKDASIAMFNEIHGYWQNLDPESRPELYLYGLSLGAYGSQASISRVELLNDPIDGALWVGPPFVSEFWNRITDNRDEGSPAWLPTYQDGRVIRFTGADNNLDKPVAQWQENKIVYLQYATDPVVFFSNDYLLNEPEWLQGVRGPGVSSDMRWYPFITYFQLAFDLANAGSTSEGYGHLYSTDDYVDSWIALTNPSNWSEEKTAELKLLLTQ